MHSSSYFYIIIWFLIPFLVGSESTSSDSSAKSALDSLLQQYAFRQLAWQRTRVGVPYDAYVPSSLTGIKISAVILKTYRLKRKVYGYYKNVFIPSGILEEPYVKKLVLVYQNLANWSSFYYPLPGYTYLTPVFGILAYNAHDLYAKSMPELEIQALKDPISIKFPYVQPASEGSFPKCVYFYSNNLVEFGHVKDGNICETRIQGHFSIVAEVKVAPSPPPIANETDPSPSPTANEAASSPSPTANEPAPSPSPSANEAAPSPSPIADEAVPSPSPSADEAAPSPSPTADEAVPSPSPSADEAAPSPSPTADEAVPSPSPSADEAAPSPSPSADEAAPSPSPTGDEAAPGPSPTADEAAPGPSPSADEAAPGPSPSADEAAPGPSPSADEAAPSPSPSADETAPSPSPTADETAPSPSHTSDENNHQKVNSKMLRISSVFLFFSLIGMLFVFVKNIELLEIKQRLYDSAIVIQPLLGTTEVPLPLEAPTRPLLENDYVL